MCKGGPFEPAAIPIEQRLNLRAELEMKSLADWRQLFDHDPTPEEITSYIDGTLQSIDECRIYKNGVYTVHVRDIPDDERGYGDGSPWPAMVHLSIKRNDRAPFHDWRELQGIKNAIVGAENDAVEIYPAESRLVDTANQYHLWCFRDANVRIPFGFGMRVVSGAASIAGSQQRPFEQ